MDAVLQGLRLAKTTLGLVPVSVPGLGPAVELALSIAELVQETKDAKDACAAMALRAAEFSLGIYEQLRKAGPEVDMASTAEHIAVLLCALKDIEGLMRRHKKMNAIKLFLKRHELKESAEKMDKRLDDAFKLFNVQNAIAAQQGLAVVTTQQTRLIQAAEDNERVNERLLERTGDIGSNLLELMQHIAVTTVAMDENGTMVLRQEDIVLVQQLHVVAMDDMDGELSPEERTVQFMARVEKTGQSVIVKKYSTKSAAFQGALRRSREIMERSKDMMRNPHITDLVGYSTPDLSFAFVAIDGAKEHRPFEEVFQAMHGIDKYVRTLEVAKQLVSAFDYLSKDLKLVKAYGKSSPTDPWAMGSRDLYFTPEGTIRWDAKTWTGKMLPSILCMAQGYMELDDRDILAIREVNPRTLRQRLGAPNPLERAATMIIIWDKLMQFTDFNRDVDCSYAVNEDFPWIGECIQSRALWGAETPEGETLRCEDGMIAVEWRRESGRAYICEFDERLQEEEHYDIPHMGYLDDLGTEALRDCNTRITKCMTTRDGLWERHTVLDMDYNVGFRTVQKLEEIDKCRRFFLGQAVHLDVPRYMSDIEDEMGPVSVVHALHFITTSFVVSLGPTPVGKPPRRLYFYSRVHDGNSLWNPDTPWGYWSTSPEPVHIKHFPGSDQKRGREFAERYKMDIEYLGFTPKFKFAWQQNLAGFIFHTEVMVVVQSYHLTADERYMMNEVHKCLTEAYQRNPRMEEEEVRKSVRRKRAEIEESEDYENAESIGWSAKRVRRG